jgi:flagellin
MAEDDTDRDTIMRKTLVEVSEADYAQESIELIDRAIERVNGIRAGIGADIAGLETNISSLSNQVYNLSNSKSRILDTDYAAESSRLTKSQIISQAASAMLVEANKIPRQHIGMLLNMNV